MQYDYKTQQDDEIDMRKGEIIDVLEKLVAIKVLGYHTHAHCYCPSFQGYDCCPYACKEDGYWYGVAGDRVGLFPGNFVTVMADDSNQDTEGRPLSLSTEKMATLLFAESNQSDSNSTDSLNLPLPPQQMPTPFLQPPPLPTTSMVSSELILVQICPGKIWAFFSI